MTSKLQHAFEEASKLPPEEQDALAAAILEEIAVDELWDKSFQKSAAALAQLAEEALREHRDGRTRPLEPDELRPPTPLSDSAKHSRPCRPMFRRVPASLTNSSSATRSTPVFISRRCIQRVPSFPHA